MLDKRKGKAAPRPPPHVRAPPKTPLTPGRAREQKDRGDRQSSSAFYRCSPRPHLRFYHRRVQCMCWKTKERGYIDMPPPKLRATWCLRRRKRRGERQRSRRHGTGGVPGRGIVPRPREVGAGAPLVARHSGRGMVPRRRRQDGSGVSGILVSAVHGAARGEGVHRGRSGGSGCRCNVGI